MKKSYLLTLFLSIALLIAGCEPKVEPTTEVEAKISVDPTSIKLDRKGGEFTILVTSNTKDYELKFDDSWIELQPFATEVNLVGKVAYRFIATENQTGALRQTTININGLGKSSGTLAEVAVSQESTDAVEVVKDDKFTPIAARALNNEFQPGSGVIEHSIDGDFETAYHSRWYDGTVMPVTLEYDMASSVEKIDYILYHSTAGNGRFGKVDLYCEFGDEQDIVKIGEYDLKQAAGTHRLTFNTEVVNPRMFRFVIHDGFGGFASCLEMEFYKFGEGNQEQNELIDRVFKSRACMELNDDASQEDINKLPYELKAVALAMLNDEYNSEFRCSSYKAYSSPELWADRNLTNCYSNLDNPTGVSVKRGEEFLVAVGDTYNNNITLATVCDGMISGESFFLSQGINRFTASDDGLLYVKYHVNDLNASNAKPIEVHIIDQGDQSTIVTGYFDSKVHKTAAELTRILNTYDYDDSGFTVFPLQGEHFQINALKRDVKARTTPQVVEALGIWDEMLFGHWCLMGIDKQFPQERNNRQLCTSTDEGYYMYATQYFVHIQAPYIPQRLNKEEIFSTGDIMWGPAHEYGHQSQKAINWHGCTESSNNLFSNLTTYQFAQKYKTGYITRGESVDELSELVLDGNLNFVEIGQEMVFLHCRMWWQLYAYYDLAMGDSNFYPTLFEQLRSGEVYNDPQAQQLQFYKATCEAAKRDLTEFFEVWGFFNEVSRDIDQYGLVHHVMTSEMAQAAIDEVKSKGYPAGAPIQFVDERVTLGSANGDLGGLDNFKNNGEIAGDASYSISGTRVSVSGCQKAVGLEIRNSEGEILKITNRLSFDTSLLGDSSNSLYAVRANGERVKLELE